jgi:uncharacterized cupin superfamily protein
VISVKTFTLLSGANFLRGTLRTMPVPEARLRETRYGLVPDGEGWFVLDARETRWRDTGPLGLYCSFESKRPFQGLGLNVNVLRPGEPMAMYHRERRQEGFLVLAGECVLVVEGEERTLVAWDFVHCPAGTAHVILGAGESPAVVVAFGARGGRRKGIEYLADPAALARGAGVEQDTTKPAEAYARFPPSSRTRYRDGLLPDL